MRRTLVTGALGQIGAELVPALRRRFGDENVIASDIKAFSQPNGLYEQLDCTQPQMISDVMRRYDIGAVYHLAALLSAVAEAKPRIAWAVNIGGLHNMLEAAREAGSQVYFPSSIAAFGPFTPRVHTPQVTIQRPTTIYGVTKVAGELLSDYYADHLGVDVRGLRLPGLISYGAAPGGGTTDYAVEMFYAAARDERYACYLAPDTRLDMMYMPDAIDAMIALMEADGAKLRHRNAYNVSAMSITPEELVAEIRKHAPRFEVDYEIDPLRQKIAESWPQSLDTSAARADWGFAPHFDLASMTRDMIVRLRAKIFLAAPDGQRREASNADARIK